MLAKQHPLDVQSVGEDTYIVMSKGHHDLEKFMAAAIKRYPGWALGEPVHVWVKTTPGRGTYSQMYNLVPEGTRGCWPATYCHEYGDGYERYSGGVDQ